MSVCTKFHDNEIQLRQNQNYEPHGSATGKVRGSIWGAIISKFHGNSPKWWTGQPTVQTDIAIHRAKQPEWLKLPIVKYLKHFCNADNHIKRHA